MMISNFHDPQDDLLIFKLISNVSEAYLSCILHKDKIIFSVAKNMGVVIEINITENEWFKFSVGFRSWGHIFVVLNGNLVGTTAIYKTEWNEYFSNNTLFGVGNGFVECNLSRFAIFENHPELNKDYNISDIQAIYNNAYFIIDSQSYYYDEQNDKYQIYNISSHSEPNVIFQFLKELFSLEFLISI